METAGSPWRILYAEADPAAAARARAELGASGHPGLHPGLHVDVLDGDREGLGRCSAVLAAGHYDLLVVTDAGWLGPLRDAGHQVAVVVLTAPGDEAAALRALEGGAVDFLPKSADYLAALPTRLRAALLRARTEQRYRRIVDSTDEGVWLIDATSATTYVNANMARMLGYTVDDMRGRALDDFMDDAGRAISHANLARRHEGIAETHEFVFRRKDGRELHAQLTTSPVFEAGQYAGALALVSDVGDRKRAEAVLRASEARYRALFEHAPDGILISDRDGRYVDANLSACRMLGYTHAQILGLRSSDLVVSGGPADWQVRRRDGSVILADVMATVLPDGNVLALVRDITERQETAERLRAAEARFRSLFEHSPNVLWEEDGSVLKRHLDQLRAEGITDFRAYFGAHPEEVARCIAMVRVLDVNNASVQQYEARDKAELIEGLARVMTPESYDVLTEEIIALAEGKTVFEAETTDQTFTGRKNHILLKTLVAPGSEHTFEKVYVSIVDITARKLAEDRVRKLASFPQLNPNAVLQLDADGSIAYANPASLQMARTFGAALTQLLPADIAEIVRACLATGRTRPPLETHHAARTLSWSFHPVMADHTVHCYAVDITERLLLEEQLRQSQKMDAIGHLAGGVAHDFNNLLTVIHGNTALLQRAKPGVELRVEALDHIAKATDRAAQLVRQLLTFSRQQVLRPRELDLNVVVVDLVKMLERVVREDVVVQVSLSPRALRTRADAGMLDQVLMNLIVNARDAMPDGGSLVLETSAFEVTAQELPELHPGTYVRVRVTDTGTGIAPEHLAHVFEPFFTTKDPGKGTGLGLATVFGIVKQHGGALGVTSEVGRGTTFSVVLPAIDQHDEVATIGDAPAPEPRGGTESILVVEDEEPVRRLVQQVLEMEGYRVQVVDSGAAALALDSGAAFDLVLTDVIMPGGVSGRDLAERLRVTKPGLKVIYMSGYTGELAGRGLELREGVNFLQKPFGPRPLLACVRGCLDAI